jgi:thiamine kinase-like enzyme
VRRNASGYGQINKVIPLTKHLEAFQSFCEEAVKVIRLHKENDVYNTINNSVINTLSELESNGVYVNKNCFSKHFDAKVVNNFVYSQYNIYTATGRPSNRFGGVNYAALNSTDGSRNVLYLGLEKTGN